MSRPHLIAAFVVNAIVGTGGIAHANDAASSATDSDESLNEVVVTGTRVAGQSRIDSISPIQVIGTSQLTDQGSRELGTALTAVARSA